MSKYNYTYTANDYLTPPNVVKLAIQILRMRYNVSKFDLDTCCTYENIPAKKYYKFNEHNGLLENWEKFNWCNCPFNQCAKWVKKAYQEQLKGNTSILLLPVRTSTKYWQDHIIENPLIDLNTDIIWLKKGVKFVNPETKTYMGVFKNDLGLVIFKGVENE